MAFSWAALSNKLCYADSKIYRAARSRSRCATPLTLRAESLYLRALALDVRPGCTSSQSSTTPPRLLLQHHNHSLRIAASRHSLQSTPPSLPSNTRKSPRKSAQCLPHCPKTSATFAASLLTPFSRFLRCRLTHPPSHLATASHKNASMTLPSIPMTSYGLKRSSYYTTPSRSTNSGWPGQKQRRGDSEMHTLLLLRSPLLNTFCGHTRISPSLQAS